MKCSPYIDRMKAISSTTEPRCGISSVISMPHFPYRRNANGEGIMTPIWSANSIWLTMSRLGAEPANFWSAGLGSNRSTWLGPPFMNRWMTAFAFGAK